MANLLQQPQQQEMPQGMPQHPQPQQPPNPQQIQELHQHLSYMQEMLDNLIKKPDNELNLRALFDGAADAVLEYQMSGGKKGVSPQIVAAEMSDPNFPTADSPASQIRQFLQGYFDKTIVAQATTTHRFGGPQQQPLTPQQQQQPPSTSPQQSSVNSQPQGNPLQ